MDNDFINKRMIDATASSARGGEASEDRERRIAERILNDEGMSRAAGEILNEGGVTLIDLSRSAYRNRERNAGLWKGKYLELTAMALSSGETVGAQVHPDMDMYIRVERGCASVLTGEAPDALTEMMRATTGYAVLIPAGTWYDIVNSARGALKLSLVRAPVRRSRCADNRG